MPRNSSHGHARRGEEAPARSFAVGQSIVVAERADAAVHEDRAADGSRMPRGELERHHRSPRMTGHEGPAEPGRAEDGERIRDDRVEAVAARRLRGEPVSASVVRHHPEVPEQVRHHQIPDPLR